MTKPLPDPPPPTAKPDTSARQPDAPQGSQPHLKDEAQGYSDTESPGISDTDGDMSEEKY